MSIRKVLVATDFSDAANGAVAEALDVARRNGAELVLLHVRDVPELATVLPQGVEVIAQEYEQMREARLADARAELEAVRRRIAGQGAEVSKILVSGFPDDMIPEVAKEQGADLTVIGTRGNSGLKRFLLGSTAERVVRMCEGDIMVARTAEASSAPKGGYRNLLLPLDLSERDQKTVDLALQLVAPEGRIHLVHFYQVPGAVYVRNKAGLDWALELRKQLAEACNRLLSSRQEALAEKHSGTVTHAVAEGDPRHGIDEVLEEGSFDLVVMSSHGRRGVRRWTLGSAAEVTVRHAPCSVVVTHDRH